jgi:hypothetical protein
MLLLVLLSSASHMSTLLPCTATRINVLSRMQLCRAALLQTDRHFYIFRIPWLRVQQLPHLIQLLMISRKICLQLLHALHPVGWHWFQPQQSATIVFACCSERFRYYCEVRVHDVAVPPQIGFKLRESHKELPQVRKKMHHGGLSNARKESNNSNKDACPSGAVRGRETEETKGGIRVSRTRVCGSFSSSARRLNDTYSGSRDSAAPTPAFCMPPINFQSPPRLHKEPKEP